MHLSKINNTFKHRISGGDEYLWTCWPDARFIEYESEHAHASVVFSSLTQIVYNAEISVKPINNTEDKYPPYRWLNPRFKDALPNTVKVESIEVAPPTDKLALKDTSSDTLSLPFNETSPRTAKVEFNAVFPRTCSVLSTCK